MGTPIRVLIVEDSEDDAALELRRLRTAGYDVTFERVESAPAMRAALDAGAWDIVISDYTMPQFSGPAAIEVLKGRGLDVPLIIVSGSIGEDIAVAAMKAGAHDYVLKNNLARLGPAVERELREARSRRAKERAEAANRTKSEFLANMSHEIRTPMTAIIGFLDLLAEPGLSAADRDGHIAVIRQNAEHLLTLINDILDLSKIEAGALVVEQIECSPSQIVGEVASLMRVKAKEKGLGFAVTSEGVIPDAIRSDPTRLRQILINLCGNAIKFTHSGSVRLVVRLGVPAGGGEPSQLAFDVIDSGIGISPDQMAGLFRPFAQADASTTRQYGGTGLGLVVSRRLARALGGDVDVVSAPGVGSTFTLTVATGPLDGVRMLDQYVESIQREARAKSGEAPDALACRVLLAEDGVHNRHLLSAYLQKAGAEVFVVADGVEAYEAAMTSQATGRPFDVILMDMQMPRLDGYGAAEKLRSDGYQGPIIALTAHAMAEDRQRCLRSGCSDYLAKPCRRSDLIRMVARHVAPSPVRPVPDAAARAASALAGELLCEDDHELEDRIALENSADADLRRFLPMFLESLPPQVDRLRAFEAGRDLKGIRDVVHQLRGTGGLYGYVAITRAAAQLEDLVKLSGEWEAVRSSLDALVNVVDQAVRGGTAQRAGGVTQPERPD